MGSSVTLVRKLLIFETDIPGERYPTSPCLVGGLIDIRGVGVLCKLPTNLEDIIKQEETHERRVSN